MDDSAGQMAPLAWARIAQRTAELGFDMASDARTGALLKTLAASKPGGRLLEIGTGTGLATSWLLSGMDGRASLVSVDNDPRCQQVARDELEGDRRLRFVLEDGLAFLRKQKPASFDLVFADAWPGKYEGLDVALALLKPGGFYVADDMLPQPNWPDGHQARVDLWLAEMEARTAYATARLNWASGIFIAVRR